MRRDWLYETHLESKNVKLIPMTTSHAEQLIEAAVDGKLWDIWYTGVPSKYSVSNYIDHALDEQARGKALATCGIPQSQSKNYWFNPLLQCRYHQQTLGNWLYLVLSVLPKNLCQHRVQTLTP